MDDLLDSDNDEDAVTFLRPRSALTVACPSTDCATMMEVLLYANAAKTILVIDLPASIAYAQSRPCEVASCTPIVQPWPVPEPKGTKRMRILARLPREDQAYHEEVARGVILARQAIEAANIKVSFLHPRWTAVSCPDGTSESGDVLFTTLDHVPLVLSTEENHMLNVAHVQNVMVTNSFSTTVRLNLPTSKSLFIPSRSSFLWSDVRFATHINPDSNFSQLIEDFEPMLKFDIILMDPPWSNRSVRRSRSYMTIEEQDSDPFHAALLIVESHLQQYGKVAIWVTNKAAIRRQVIAAMQDLHLELLEEWVWIKVTSGGQPVTPLDSIWRKPYEILLIFGRHSRISKLLRRYIFGVPDFHSRKPNMKLLFDSFFQPQTVLELFARNLTSGWWSIGNEVLKFQDAQFFRVQAG